MQEKEREIEREKKEKESLSKAVRNSESTGTLMHERERES
jgi:hypothetical protein